MNTGAEAWAPSSGWEQGFRKRHDITCVSAAGEALSADWDEAARFVVEFQDLKQKYG
jgi:hypothetical protein